MSELLLALWNGTLAPVRHLSENDEELRHLEELIARHEKTMAQLLCEAQTPCLENYRLCMEEHSSLMAEQAFCSGFCLGLKLSAEAFLVTE
ncbi:MAG: hypothetical protein IKD11_04745 [Oscillospiraceae bacterium]|nr:hypothetical protein [Oscillospiraceae bacterium]